MDNDQTGAPVAKTSKSSKSAATRKSGSAGAKRATAKTARRATAKAASKPARTDKRAAKTTANGATKDSARTTSRKQTATAAKASTASRPAAREIEALKRRLYELEQASAALPEIEAALPHQGELASLDARIARLEETTGADSEARRLGAIALLAAQQTKHHTRAMIGEQRWQQWLERSATGHRVVVRLRNARIGRAFQHSMPTRAALLLFSGMRTVQDGPGGRAIVAYASRKTDAPAPHPLFDQAWYLNNSPDVASSSMLPAIHYLLVGDGEGRSPHPLFSPRWYRERYGDLLESWPLTTLEHFLMRGARERLNPHPLFDPYYYVANSPSVFRTGQNPLWHYLSIGWREGTPTHPLFDGQWYLERYPDAKAADVAPLLHFATIGRSKGYDPHPLLSTRFYLTSNPDVANLGIDPIEHYINNGWREGRKPSPYFDPQYYLRSNPDVSANGGSDPLTHYLTAGAWENRRVAPHLDLEAFLSAYPQAATNKTPLQAWIEMGRPQPVAPKNRQQTPQSLVPAAINTTDPTEIEEQEEPGAYGWRTYLALSRSIADNERKRIEGLTLPLPPLLDFNARELATRAAKLSFAQPEKPEVSIVIPVYGHVKYTVECLASLARTRTKRSFEVIVADDASPDNTAQILSRIKGVRHLQAETNQGFLKNVNAAVREARGKYLIILNNDVQMAPGWLDPLIDALQDEDVGIAGPKFVFPNGRLQEAGAQILRNGTANLVGLFDDPQLPRYNRARDVDYVSGACIAMRRDLFESLDGFDQRYAPAYCEDADLCLRVRDLGKTIRFEPKSTLYHHLSVTSNAQPGDYKQRQATRNQQKLIERWQPLINKLNEVQVIALHLPQFHAIPENDKWWGKGFTEWTNASKAKPNFDGHYQPHRPAELGYYDLSDPEGLERQAELAQAHGIHGFCYYYYSFSGRRILEKPIETMLTSGKPDMPFCICWANENWTRTWDGREKDVLLKQEYRERDDQVIIEDIIRYLESPNYIRVNGRPLLVVYRPQLLPNPKRTMETWRKACRKAGIGEICLAFVETFENALTYPDPKEYGFDFTIEFPPAGMTEPIAPSKILNPKFTGVVNDYRRVVQRYMKEPIPAHPRFRAVMPSWDNTPRRQDISTCFHHASPGALQAWLEAVIKQTREQNSPGERLVFVNAWNEWGEGAHLEPDERFGRGWLEAVRNALEADQQLSFAPQQG